MNAQKRSSASALQEIQTASQEIESTSDDSLPKKHDKRALVVFFSFVAGLIVLVALNMK